MIRVRHWRRFSATSCSSPATTSSATSCCFSARFLGSSRRATSYALALEFYELGRALMTAAGVHDQGDVDVFTALVSGLSHQQIANDPGGTRWVRHASRVVEMFLADVDRRLQTTHTKGGSR